MVKYKYAFGLSILIVVVLLSGCLNSNEQNQNNQPISHITPAQTDPIPIIKIINLYANQLVLDDNDIKGVLGNEWTKYDTPKGKTHQFSNVPTSSIINLLYSTKEPFGMWGSQTVKGEYINMPVDISVRVYNNFADAKEDYLKLYNNYYIGNNIDIGDEGSIYTIKLEYLLGDMQIEKYIIKVVFRKNNVISLIYLTSDKRYDENVSFNVDTAIKLAKKQDEKLSRMLEMIK